MILDDLKNIIEINKNPGNNLYLRTLLKEVIQNYVLNFVYNDRKYKELIFTGGTCLRKIYGLPRLSEDLDFDFLNNFEIEDFARTIKIYFKEKLQYADLDYKISNKNNTLFLKFPILKELGLTISGESGLLFLRCDFSWEAYGGYKTEINRISTKDFTFFVNSYDLPTLFANKIAAFLERKFFKGSEQSFAFKGRDVYDISWFLERSSRDNFKLQPNWERIFKILGVKEKEEVIEMITDKLKKIDKKSLMADLLPFIENRESLDSFGDNFLDLIEAKLKYL